MLLLASESSTDRAWRRFQILLRRPSSSSGGRGDAAPIQVSWLAVAAIPATGDVPRRGVAAEAGEPSDERQVRYGVPPAIAAGDWWLAGNVCCFAPSRPTLYSSREPAGAGYDPRRDRGDPRRFAWPEPETAPWTGDEDLRRRGGVLVWDVAMYGEDMPG